MNTELIELITAVSDSITFNLHPFIYPRSQFYAVKLIKSCVLCFQYGYHPKASYLNFISLFSLYQFNAQNLYIRIDHLAKRLILRPP